MSLSYQIILKGNTALGHTSDIVRATQGFKVVYRLYVAVVAYILHHST